ncbi:MAG: thiamine-phosphate kinase [Proteobacteria bacterium]|nr:MAG: thiamine-phosphate kinase [Pseudomonadota bacterium]
MSGGEFDLIQQCFVSKASYSHAHTVVGNGDDASVHGLAENEQLVVSTDMAVQGVHWPDDFPLDLAADRAVCAALSDLAAMGAKACWAWVSVVAEDSDALAMMGLGVGNALNRYDVELSGGDTVHAACNSLNITVAGIVEKNTSMQRNKAKVADNIWILGNSGLASLGLQQWFSGHKDADFVESFSHIEPKLKQGNLLREMGVRCCIDVSDGVLQDAGHISKASQIAMQLDVEKFPDWQRLSEKLGDEKAMQAMLSGGEDYALLFTAPANMKGLDKLATCMGVCVPGSDVQAYYQGEMIHVVKSGYDHFASK